MNTEARMQLSTSLKRDIFPQHQLLNSLFQFSIDHQFSIAVWQLPGSQTKQLLLSKQARRIQREEVVLEELNSGFIFAPFDRSQDAIFLDADYLFTFNDGNLQNPKSKQEENAH
jgi:isochorismate synthase